MAHRITHPFHSKPTSTRPVSYALAHSISDALEARAQREQMQAFLEDLANAVAPEEQDITDLVDDFIRPILKDRRVGFMREVSWASGFPDPTLMVGLVLGLPALGWACRAPLMQVRFAPPLVPVAELSERLDEHNRYILGRIIPSKDVELDKAA